MEAVTDTSLPGREISAIAARIRSAISSAAAISVSGSRTANSSPPLRPAKSLAPQRAAQHRADVRQDLVAHRVPALVVDLLEVVQVDQEQRERRLGRRGLGERPLQRVGDGALVGQPGQAVGRGADLRDGQVAQVGQHGRGLADRLADPLLLRLGVPGRAAEQHRADHLAAHGERDARGGAGNGAAHRAGQQGGRPRPRGAAGPTGPPGTSAARRRAGSRPAASRPAAA